MPSSELIPTLGWDSVPFVFHWHTISISQTMGRKLSSDNCKFIITWNLLFRNKKRSGGPKSTMGTRDQDDYYYYYCYYYQFQFVYAAGIIKSYYLSQPCANVIITQPSFRMGQVPHSRQKNDAAWEKFPFPPNYSRHHIPAKLFPPSYSRLLVISRPFITANKMFPPSLRKFIATVCGKTPGRAAAASAGRAAARWRGTGQAEQRLLLLGWGCVALLKPVLKTS